jgi:hypothetical protein
MLKRMELGMCVALHGWQVYSGIFVEFFPSALLIFMHMRQLYQRKRPLALVEKRRSRAGQRWKIVSGECACLEGWTELN